MRRNGYYMIGERQVPSVSKILKSAGDSSGLMNWAAMQGGMGVYSSFHTQMSLDEIKESSLRGLRKESNRVADFGSNVHYGIECHLKKQDCDMSKWSNDEKKSVMTFIEFYEDIGFEADLIEATVLSGEYGGDRDWETRRTQLS